MARKRRPFELFSLSFLDCICCGFGAMLLLFVLLIGRNANKSRDELISSILREIASLEIKTQKEQKETGEIRDKLQITEQKLALEISNREVQKRDLTELQDDFALMLQQRSSLKDEIDRLLGIKNNMPTQEERPPLPIPNAQRRQYLTGFNFEGNYMVIMVETSGGMLGYTVDDAIAKQRLSDEDKKKSEKWRRVVRAVQWIVANLGANQNYQIVTYGQETKPLLSESNDQWLQPHDRDTTVRVIKQMDEIVPVGGANLERAFINVRSLFPSVDSVVLLADGLPTQSDSFPVASTDDRDREKFFRAAMKEAPRQTPINTILFPMSGDPAAPYLFWLLADGSKGSLISPAPSWPDI